MRLADEWDTIVSRRAAEVLPAPDPWEAILSRRAAEVLPTPDPWDTIVSRRAAETAPAISHAKTIGPWFILLAAAGVLFTINFLNERHVK